MTARHKPQQITMDQYLEAIHKSGGIYSAIAELLGAPYITVYSRISRNERLKRAMAEAGERMKDIAESKLFKAVNNGDKWAIRYFLERKAKDRGYAERVEHTGENGGPMQHEHGLTPEAKELLQELLNG